MGKDIAARLSARLGAPGEYVDYAASKAAIDTLTKSLGEKRGPKTVADMIGDLASALVERVDPVREFPTPSPGRDGVACT